MRGIFFEKSIFLKQLFITLNKNFGPKPHCCVAPTVMLNETMTRKKLTFTIGVIFPVLGIFFYYLVWTLSPGSYSRAEVYELKVSEEKLIAIINDCRTDNHTLVIPEAVNLKEGRKDSTDHWYNIYFYYPEKKQIIKTWTRPKTKTTTSFGFVAINHGLELGKWQQVNDNFLWWKNTPIKDEFENRILNNINEKINEE